MLIYKQNYNLETTYSISSEDVTLKQEKKYQRQIQDQNSLAIYLSFMDCLYGGNILNPKQEEEAYEREQSLVYFPTVNEELEAIRQDKIRLGLITE